MSIETQLQATGVHGITFEHILIITYGGVQDFTIWNAGYATSNKIFAGSICNCWFCIPNFQTQMLFYNPYFYEHLTIDSLAYINRKQSANEC